MDSLSILLKSILQAPTDADINKVKEDLQRKLSNIKINTSTNGKGIKVLDETEIANYQKHMQNMMTNLRTKYGSLLDSGQIKKDVDMFNTAMSGMGKNGLGKKDLGLQFETLTTKVRSSSSALRLATQDADSFASTLGKDFTKFSLWFGIGTIFMSFIHGISDAITYTNQLDNSLNEIRIVTGKTQEQVTGLANSYNKLAKEMSVTTAEIASEAANLFRQGLGESEVETRMKSIIQYAKISSISIADSDKIITATANATGESVTKIIDIFALLGDQTASGADEIGEALQKVASAAENSNISLEKSASWIATISSITRESASTIGRSINSIISRYESIKSTGFNSEDATKLNNVVEALSQIGITATDSMGQLKPFADVMDAVGAKFSSLSKNEQAYIATTMFGTFQRNKGLTLLQNYNTSLANYETALNSAGTAEQKFNIYQESTQAKLDKLKASIEGFWQSSVDSSLIKGTIDALNSLVSTFGNLQTIIPVVITSLALFKGASITTGLITGFTNLSKNITETGGILNLASKNMRQYTVDTRYATLIARGMTEEQALLKVSTLASASGFSVLGNAIKTAFLSNPIGIILTALTSLIMIIDIVNQKQEEANQAREEAISKITEESTALNDLKAQYTDIISSGDLTTESKERLKGIQDQLIKTYGIEANAIDLVNGKYNEQIKTIDEVSAKKYEEIKRSMGATGLEAQSKLFTPDTTSVNTSPGWIGQMLSDTSKLDNALSDLQGKYSDKILFGGSDTLKINGTLEERVTILGELSDSITDIASKDERYIGIANDIAGKYNTLNDELKKNQDVWNKYAEADFFSKYKKQISEVHDLQSKLTQEKDTKKKSVIQEQIDGVKDSITKSKGYISDYKNSVDNLFTAPKLSTKIEESVKTEIKSFEDLTKEVKSVVASVKDLNDIQADLSKGNKLTADSVLDIVTKYPELLDYIHQTADGYTIEAKGMDIVREALINKQMVTLESESGITEIMKTALQSRLNVYGIELDSIKTLNDAREAFYKVNQNTPRTIERMAGLYADQATLDSIAKLNSLKELLKSGIKTGVKTPKTSTTASTTKSLTALEAEDSLKLIDIIIQSAEKQSKVTAEKNKQIEAQIKIAKQQKDYNLELELTNKLISGQSKEINDLESAKAKIKAKEDLLTGTSAKAKIKAQIDAIDKQLNPTVDTKTKKTPNYGKGNIDLNNRPIIKNKDGSISTVYSQSFTDDSGKAILVAGVRKGLDRKMTTKEAWNWYLKTGEYLGKFKTEAEANKYAESLHEDQAKLYVPQTVKLTPSQKTSLIAQKDKLTKELSKTTALDTSTWFNADGGASGDYLKLDESLAKKHNDIVKKMNIYENKSSLSKSEKADYASLKNQLSANDNERKSVEELFTSLDKLKKEYVELTNTQATLKESNVGLGLDKISLSFTTLSKSQEPLNKQLAELEHSYKMLSESDLAGKEANINKQMNIKKQLLASNNKAIADYTNAMKKASEAGKELYQDEIDTLVTANYALEEALKESTKKANDDKLNLYNDSVNSIVDLLKKQYDIEADLREKAHDAEVDALDDRLDAYKDYVNDKISEIDKLKNAEDYNKDIADKTSEITDIQNEIAKYSMATTGDNVDLEALLKVNELKKDLAEKQENLAETQSDHEVDLRKDNLKDSLDAFEDYIDDQKDAEKESYNNYKELLAKKTEATALQLEAQKLLTTGTISEISAAITTLFTNTNSNATEAGKVLQEQIIDKLAELKEINDNISSITAKSSSGSGLTNTNTVSDDTLVKVNQGISGNSVLETVASVEERQEKRYNDAITAGNTTLANQIRKQTEAATGRSAPFDEGGTASGIGYLPKNIIEPERVLSPEQTISFDKLAKFLPSMNNLLTNVMPNINSYMPQISSVNSGSGFTIGDINLTVQGSISDSNRVKVTSDILTGLKNTFTKSGIISR